MITLKNKWLASYYVPKAKARARLFCLPYAGSGATLYRKWQSIFKEDIDVCPIQLPGRENRLSEKQYTDVKNLAFEIYKQISDLFDKPYFIFGHSMGGVITYELARIIEEHGEIMPKWIYMSASSVFSANRGSKPVHTLDDKELRYYLKKYITDIPEADNEIYQKIFFPLIRNDYQLVENYYHCHEKQLSCGIHTFASISDKVFNTQLIEKMSFFTKDFQIKYIEGDHLFITSKYDQVCNLIEEEILKACKVNDYRLNIDSID